MVPGQVQLSVYYTCEGWDDQQIKEEDDYAHKLTGVNPIKRSTNQFGVRELKFSFPDELALNKAKLELKDGGFRFVP